MFCFVLVFFYINSLLLKYRKKKEKTTIINVVVEFGVFFFVVIYIMLEVSVFRMFFFSFDDADDVILFATIDSNHPIHPFSYTSIQP